MKFEVFHHGLLGRPDIIAVDMIHYSGLWGLCFSHHPPHNNHPRYAADTTTAGVLRFLEASQQGRDVLDLRTLAHHTITTHHVDADAVLPVWALQHPEGALERRPLLERVARCGDFFLYLEETSARINFVIEELHRQLRGSGIRGERLVDNALTHACFERLLPCLTELLDDPDRYVELWELPVRAMHADLDYLSQPGRITECWQQHTSLVETDHLPDTHALNTLCRNDLLLVWRTDTPERRLDVRPAIAWYELTSMPHRPRYDLNALAMFLNAAEVAAGHKPCWRYQPGPVMLQADSSCLCQETVLQVVGACLDSEPESHVQGIYRRDVRDVFRYQPQHAIFTAHRRFADADEIRFTPGQGYEGLYCLAHTTAKPSERQTAGPANTLSLGAGKTPAAFTVSDDFYWNCGTPEPLELSVTCDDSASGTFWVEYDAWDDPYRRTTPAHLCGDGRTKSLTFSLENARLGNSQEGGADLC